MFEINSGRCVVPGFTRSQHYCYAPGSLKLCSGISLARGATDDRDPTGKARKRPITMPRSKAYDRDAVLQKAMLFFWKKGYEATGIEDLEKRMGINRFSIYSTF